MLKQTFRIILFRGRKTTLITKQLFHNTCYSVGEFAGHLRENESRQNDGNVNNALKNFKCTNLHSIVSVGMLINAHFHCLEKGYFFPKDHLDSAVGIIEDKNSEKVITVLVIIFFYGRSKSTLLLSK